MAPARSFALVLAGLLALSAGPTAADAPVPAPAVRSTSPQSTTAAAAQTPSPPLASVMFTPAELQSIEKAATEHEHPVAQSEAQAAATEQVVTAAAPKVPNIYLSAVVDFGGGDWTVWANGLRVTPEHQPALFQVTAVRGNNVEFLVPSDGGSRFRLAPYQTWRSRQRDVVEGIVP